MKKWICLPVLWAVLLALLAAPVPAAWGATAIATNAPAKPPPGVEAAQTISTITGVAISPLLGVGAMGAWKYFRANHAQGGHLPWFAHPWFWVPALVLVGLVFLKDTLGPAMPTVLKKFLDLLEVFENKLSALLAAGAIIPIVAAMAESSGDSSPLAGSGLATIEFAPLATVILIALALAAFLVVWLAAHTVNILILVSPFTTVDALLKVFRLSLVLMVVATAWVNPYVGAACAMVLIVISYFIAGWSFRMMVFGTVFAWDMVTFRAKRYTPDLIRNRAFTARRMENVPVRTYGWLMRDGQGRLVLHYRPWLVLPARTLDLGPGPHLVGRGLLYPELRRIEADETQAQLAFPPRCRTHEDRLTQIYSFAPAQDIGLRRGMIEVWRWLKGAVGYRFKPPITAPAAT